MKNGKGKLPIGKAEDVKFNYEFADEHDIEALQRAEAADRRAIKKEKQGK
jgi:hypothetical protein